MIASKWLLSKENIMKLTTKLTSHIGLHRPSFGLSRKYEFQHCYFVQ